MDFQHRPGGKTGGGGVASWSESNTDRRERLRQLALETIDLNKDPYFMKNHLGSYECKLCLTLHNNEGSYLAHTQGKKHQANLARRAAKEAKDAPTMPAPEKPRVEAKKFVKIGRPGYRVTKQKDPENNQQSLLFQIDYPEIVEGIVPRHRFMSAYEQKIEPPDKKWQYLLFAVEPYETIAFKVPSREVDKSAGKFWSHWNEETKQFFLQCSFKVQLESKQPKEAVPSQLAPGEIRGRLPPGPGSGFNRLLPPPPPPMQHGGGGFMPRPPPPPMASMAGGMQDSNRARLPPPPPPPMRLPFPPRPPGMPDGGFGMQQNGPPSGPPMMRGPPPPPMRGPPMGGMHGNLTRPMGAPPLQAPPPPPMMGGPPRMGFNPPPPPPSM